MADHFGHLARKLGRSNSAGVVRKVSVKWSCKPGNQFASNLFVSWFVCFFLLLCCLLALCQSVSPNPMPAVEVVVLSVCENGKVTPRSLCELLRRTTTTQITYKITMLVCFVIRIPRKVLLFLRDTVRQTIEEVFVSSTEQSSGRLYVSCEQKLKTIAKALVMRNCRLRRDSNSQY